MAQRFAYPCPDCRTTNNLHDPGCEFAGRPHPEVEKAYTDLLARLALGPMPDDDLRSAVHGDWSALHEAALGQLRSEHRVEEVGGDLELLTPAERVEELREPTHEPIKTIYEKGSVPGCHDNAVFAMIAWYEMVGLSWAETSDHVVDWLHDSGTWARGGFEESTPEELLAEKRHVYEQGYGWKEKAQAAKRVIEGSL